MLMEMLSIWVPFPCHPRQGKDTWAMSHTSYHEYAKRMHNIDETILELECHRLKPGQRGRLWQQISS